MSRWRAPVPLAPDHTTEGFDCGRDELNVWLRQRASVAQAAGLARTFVSLGAGSRVVGYYALAAAEIAPTIAPARAKRGMPRHPIPAALLARLAVDRRDQGRGLGALLLRDAMLRVLQAADSLGIRVLLVHAMDDDARAFYEHLDFEPSPTDPLHLTLLLKDVRRALAARAG